MLANSTYSPVNSTVELGAKLRIHAQSKSGRTWVKSVSYHESIFSFLYINKIYFKDWGWWLVRPVAETPKLIWYQIFAQLTLGFLGLRKVSDSFLKWNKI